MKKLPTKDEYIEHEGHIDARYPIENFSEPKYICPNCQSGGMCKDLTKVCTSLPPRYIYQCNVCGYVDYLPF